MGGVGSSSIPWSGVGASTASTFDPQTGKIVGGYITFENPADASALQNASIAEDRRVRDGSFTYDWLASTYLRKAEFLNLRSPIPELIVESILLHEVGHFNGLAHNFKGSLDGTVTAPSRTIMDYVPFPAVGHFIDLGDFDYQAIDLVYRSTPLNARYRFGGDYESISSNPSRYANANSFDIGDPVDWYLALSACACFQPRQMARRNGGVRLNLIRASLKRATQKSALEIRELLGPFDGFYFTDAYPTYLIQIGKSHSEDTWQIVFLLDDDRLVKKFIIHKNCCD